MIFGNAITFSVSGNFRPDFGIGLMLRGMRSDVLSLQTPLREIFV
jgi:hypothetical protein